LSKQKKESVMRLLPQTKSKTLMFVVLVICSGIAYLCGLQFYLGGVERALFAVVFLMPVGVGLWLLKEAARLLVSAIIMLLVIFVPFGIINPFAAMDALGPNPPDAWKLAMAVFPWVVVGLWLVHILGKHKSEFTPVFKRS
jgi:hypothetical protein